MIASVSSSTTDKGVRTGGEAWSSSCAGVAFAFRRPAGVSPVRRRTRRAPSCDPRFGHRRVLERNRSGRRRVLRDVRHFRPRWPPRNRLSRRGPGTTRRFGRPCSSRRTGTASSATRAERSEGCGRGASGRRARGGRSTGR